VSERTVCLSVRVSPEEAEQVTAWAKRHGVTVQQVLHRCVVAATEAMAPVVLTADEAMAAGEAGKAIHGCVLPAVDRAGGGSGAARASLRREARS
jgi:hypothetical protein